jgi:hypothetical protein
MKKSFDCQYLMLMSMPMRVIIMPVPRMMQTLKYALNQLALECMDRVQLDKTEDKLPRAQLHPA